jgi:hypothetical protein
MRRAVLNQNQPALPFPPAEVRLPGNEAVELPSKSTFPARSDPMKAENKRKIPGTGSSVCVTCNHDASCRDLEFNKNSQAFDTLVEDRSCPLSAILGVDVLSFPRWRQRLIIRLRVIKEKRSREKDSQMQHG